MDFLGCADIVYATGFLITPSDHVYISDQSELPGKVITKKINAYLYMKVDNGTPA